MNNVRFGFAMGGKFNRPPSPARERVKRGGSGTFALTNTLDPSLYPTSPPKSSYVQGVPKIAGSEGGFVGLIVGLAVLIIVCCCAVYYLLSTRKHGGRAGNKNYPPSATFTDSKGLFTSLPFRGARGQNAGWVQQHGDEFDYNSDEDLMPRKDPAGHAGYGTELGKYRDRETGYTGQHAQREPKPKLYAAVDAYTDPFDPDHLPESVYKQQAPLPASASSLSQHPPLYKPLGDGTLKTSPTTPTFENGTKFREQF